MAAPMSISALASPCWKHKLCTSLQVTMTIPSHPAAVLRTSQPMNVLLDAYSCVKSSQLSVDISVCRLHQQPHLQQPLLQPWILLHL